MIFKSIQYSAPGRLFLSGEHAVVYGKPAIVSAIDKRLSITFTRAKKTKYTDAIFPILEQSALDFLNEKKIPFSKTGYSYVVESSIPIGRGLGSSAAYCACISAGLLELFTGKEWVREEVNRCAYKMEKYFHKNASGVDTSTSVMGGLIYYRKEFEFLKTISSLALKIPKKIIDSLLLIDTGKPAETSGEVIQSVGVLFNKQTKKIEAALNEMEKTTKRIIVSLMKEDVQFFKENIIANEKLLEQIGVVSPSTIHLLDELRKVGVGKVTGAGGKKDASGYILFFCDDIHRCKQLLDEKSIQYMPFVTSYSGLVKEL